MMQAQTKFCLCFTKINIKLFSGAPKVPLISQVSLSPKIKNSFLGVSVWDYQPQILYISSKVTIKTQWAFSIKCYSQAAMDISFIIIIFYYISPTKQFLNIKILSWFFDELSKS